MKNKFESKDNELELSTELGEELSDSELASIAGGSIASCMFSNVGELTPKEREGLQKYQGKA